MSKKVRSDQSGMVSILVTMIMMIVMTLIVIGFAQVARHNAREALDRQLASQAFYAAETGVNDVLGIYHKSGWTDPTPNDPSCTDSGSVLGKNPSLNPALHTQADGTIDVAYTCLTVTPDVPNIAEDMSTFGDTKAVTLKMSAANSLVFSWHSSDKSATTAAGCPTNTLPGRFTPAIDASPSGRSSWTSTCKFGILRVDLFDIDANGAATDPDTLATNTAALYLVPASVQSGVPTFGGTSVIKANCTAGMCTATLAKADIHAHQNYAIRLSSVYEATPGVSIAGPAGSGVTFSNAQLLIDSTGRAQDELRRIQVRIDLNGDQPVAGYALQSSKAICKRYITLGQSDSTAGGGSSDTPNIPDQLCSSD